MAFIMRIMDQKGLSVENRALAERKLVRWFVASILSRRYQQSTHDKQARDKVEILKWIEGNDEDAPQWFKDTSIPNLKASNPDSAIGKLLRALANHNGLLDPYSQRAVGVGSGKQTSAKHHIFPTRFAKNLIGWDETEDTVNLALNIMYTEEGTNASWLHLDPAQQLATACKVLGGKALAKTIYMTHGIPESAFSLMEKANKSRDDFRTFLELREAYFVNVLERYGFQRASTGAKGDEVSDDEEDE